MTRRMSHTHLPTGLRPIAVAISFFAALGLNGCMLMHMAHGGHGSHGADLAAQGIVKERAAGDFVIQLEVPALYAGQEAHLQVRVMDASHSESVEAERVLVRVQRQGETVDALVEEQVAGRSQKGVYVVQHTFDRAGSYDVSATADLPGGQTRQISVTVTREVAELGERKPPQEPGKGLLILGGVGMGLMMVIMML